MKVLAKPSSSINVGICRTHVGSLASVKGEKKGLGFHYLPDNEPSRQGKEAMACMVFICTPMLVA